MSNGARIARIIRYVDLNCPQVLGNGTQLPEHFPLIQFTLPPGSYSLSYSVNLWNLNFGLSDESQDVGCEFVDPIANQALGEQAIVVAPGNGEAWGINSWHLEATFDHTTTIGVMCESGIASPTNVLAYSARLSAIQLGSLTVLP